jgi:hypothetical protein
MALVAVDTQNDHLQSTGKLEHLFMQKNKKSIHYAFQYITRLMNWSCGVYEVVFRHPYNFDLFGDAYLYIDFDQETSIESLFDIIQSIQILFENSVYDSYSGDAMRIYANNPKYKIEQTNNNHRFIIPLAFFFQNQPDSYIPVLVINNHSLSFKVIVNTDNKIKNIALKNKIIHLQSIDRRGFAANHYSKDIFVTCEEKFTDVCASVQGATKIRLSNQKFNFVAKHLYIYLKPKNDSGSDDPIQQIDFIVNGKIIVRLDNILSRKIIPRNYYDIHENNELIYYIPADLSYNLSRLRAMEIILTFANKGIYDVVVVASVSNIFRVQSGFTGLGYIPG